MCFFRVLYPLIIARCILLLQVPTIPTYRALFPSISLVLVNGIASWTSGGSDVPKRETSARSPSYTQAELK